MNIQRGEIIRINLNPTQGREQSGNARPCLVLSNSQFNQRRKGIVVITPLTNTVKPEVKTLVQVPSGFKVTGSVIAEQVRTIDLKDRWWQATGEILPEDFVDLVTHIFKQIIS
ncbi:MAG: type II toxin-antitoxin system PemK/MazF family toxin [Xenococcaceae cyanobacterium MO_167.B27]|nr:type II toxin-antitoxin system PemK/MazF family toxin [Xenococcaceae cyanobacterium MO_167.B27]